MFIKKLVYKLFNYYKNRYIKYYTQGDILVLHTFKGKQVINNRTYFRNSYQSFFTYGFITRKEQKARLPISTIISIHSNRSVICGYSNNGYIIRNTNKTNLTLKGTSFLPYESIADYQVIPYKGTKLDHLKNLQD